VAKKEINTEALVKLLERAFELAESQQAVLQEMRAIIGGELGIGAKLRLVYDGFSNAWRERYSRTVTDPKKGGYVWNYAKEGPAAKRLLQRRSSPGRRATSGAPTPSTSRVGTRS